MKKSESSTPKAKSPTWNIRLDSCESKEQEDLSVEEQKKDSLQPNKKDYQGPLYAPHPDIKKKK